MIGIKGFKMPECCYDCDLCYDMIGCSVMGVDWEPLYMFEPDEERSKNCPLVDLGESLVLNPTEEQKRELIELLKKGVVSYGIAQTDGKV